MGATRDEIERDFRRRLKQLACLGCSAPISDAAIDWGRAQPSEYAKDGPFPLKCEGCGAVQHYDVFTRKLTLV